MGSQRAGHNLVTEQQYNHYKFKAEGIEMPYYELYFKYIYILKTWKEKVNNLVCP